VSAPPGGVGATSRLWLPLSLARPGLLLRLLLSFMFAYLLEDFKRLGKQQHDLAPSGHRNVCAFDARQRCAGPGRNDEFGWDLEAASFCSVLDLFRRAHHLGDNVIAAETEAVQRGDCDMLIVAPMALGAAGRECVAGHGV